jgi:hypothetical protein
VFWLWTYWDIVGKAPNPEKPCKKAA